MNDAHCTNFDQMLDYTNAEGEISIDEIGACHTGICFLMQCLQYHFLTFNHATIHIYYFSLTVLIQGTYFSVESLWKEN